MVEPSAPLDTGGVEVAGDWCYASHGQVSMHIKMIFSGIVYRCGQYPAYKAPEKGLLST